MCKKTSHFPLRFPQAGHIGAGVAPTKLELGDLSITATNVIYYVNTLTHRYVVYYIRLGSNA